MYLRIIFIQNTNVIYVGIFYDIFDDTVSKGI